MCASPRISGACEDMIEIEVKGVVLFDTII